MGAAAVEYREIRFIIREHWTEVYVLCQALGDCPLGVQGWHHKESYPGVPIEQILHEMFTSGEDPILWPPKAPEGG